MIKWNLHILNIYGYLKCTNLNRIESQTYIFFETFILHEDWNEIIQYFAHKWYSTNEITLLIAVGKLRTNVSFEIFKSYTFSIYSPDYLSIL